jgi:hypothetical protein
LPAPITIMQPASRIPRCTILSDEFNHASMIEGIRHSRSETRIFAHNDPRDLERKLSDLDQHAPKLVAFESVYSIDGDIAPISEPCDVADAYNASAPAKRVRSLAQSGHRLRHLIIVPITTIKILTVAPEVRSGRAWVRSKRIVIWKNDGLLRL